MEFPNFVLRSIKEGSKSSIHIVLEKAISYDNLIDELRLIMYPDIPSFQSKFELTIVSPTISFSYYYYINPLHFILSIQWKEILPKPSRAVNNRYKNHYSKFYF